MDSIRPLSNYNGGIVPKAVLNGTLGTVVYASNYNDLDNKPSINSVELRGNKTAEDLGLATPEDITVTSVNNQTGDVSLTGQNIPYDSMYSVTEKINDLESQITDSGVTSVNGKTGVVNLTGTDINYSAGVTLNSKIDAVENEIPEVNYPVTSVNGKTGAVVLAGSDIEYSAGVSINTQLENVAGDLADLTAEDIPMSGTDSTPTATAIGSLSQLTTTDKSSLVGAVNEVVANKATTGSAITFAPETGITAAATSAVINKTVLLNLTFSGSFTQNTWKKIGAMNVTPSISTIYVAGIHSSDGLYAGMIQIRSDKGIYFYPKTAISGTVGCTANFNIT